MVQNPRRTGFVEAPFASRQKGNFGSVSDERCCGVATGIFTILLKEK
jgi:hypothetical protein